MEHVEKALTPQESLRIIRDTIDLAKQSFRDNGYHFLLWGWLVVIACMGNWYMALNQFEHPEWVWGIMVLIGMPASLVREWLRSKKETAPNIVHEWYGMIWLAYGISMALAIALVVTIGHSPIAMILILTGFATFLSGVILRYKPLMMGGVIFWAGALSCFFLPQLHHLLIQAACSVLGYLIPGYLLNHQTRQNDVSKS